MVYRRRRLGVRPRASFGDIFTSYIAPTVTAAGNILDSELKVKGFAGKSDDGGGSKAAYGKYVRPYGQRNKAWIGAAVGAATSIASGIFGAIAQRRAEKKRKEQEFRKNQLKTMQDNASAFNKQMDYISQNQNNGPELEYRYGGAPNGKRLGANNFVITDGGDARRIGHNTYLLRGGSHEDVNETGQTGIGINVGGNEIEAEGGEVAQKKGNSLRIFSAQPILDGGVSPAEAVESGANKDKVFNAQQAYKKRNHLKDDGSKAKYGSRAKSNDKYYDWMGAVSSNNRRHEYMYNSGEGYFDGKRDVFPRGKQRMRCGGRAKRELGGGYSYIPKKNIHIDDNGNAINTSDNKSYTLSATNGNDVVVTAKRNNWKEAGKNDTSPYFDPAGPLTFLNAVAAPILNLTPSNIFGSVREAKDYNSFMDNFMNHKSGGFFNKEYAANHPYLSFAGNLLGDIGAFGLAGAAAHGAKAVSSAIASERPYLSSIMRSRLYSNNPLVNTYATYARRYNLPDKARLPYLIRRINSNELPNIKDGNIDLQGSRFEHTNFTTDRPVVSHKQGKWDAAQQTYLLNPREVVPSHKWGSIEPSDMFNIDTNKSFNVNTKDATLITGDKVVENAAKKHGIRTVSNSRLREVENKTAKEEQAAVNGKFAKDPRTTLYDREYWDATNDAIKHFGSPKLKDYKLLEQTTGLKSGTVPLKQGKALSELGSKYYGMKLDEASKYSDATFPNGRSIEIPKDLYPLTHPYNNVFYDPASWAEFNYKTSHPKFRRLGGTSRRKSRLGLGGRQQAKDGTWAKPSYDTSRYNGSKSIRKTIAKYEGTDFPKQNAQFNGDAVGAKEKELRRFMGKAYGNLSDNQRDALLSYYYNVKPSTFTNRYGTLRDRLINARNAAEFNDTINLMKTSIDTGMNNKKLPGLRKRRLYEQGLFGGNGVTTTTTSVAAPRRTSTKAKSNNVTIPQSQTTNIAPAANVPAVNAPAQTVAPTESYQGYGGFVPNDERRFTLPTGRLYDYIINKGNNRQPQRFGGSNRKHYATGGNSSRPVRKSATVSPVWKGVPTKLPDEWDIATMFDNTDNMKPSNTPGKYPYAQGVTPNIGANGSRQNDDFNAWTEQRVNVPNDNSYWRTMENKTGHTADEMKANNEILRSDGKFGYNYLTPTRVDNEPNQWQKAYDEIQKGADEWQAQTRINSPMTRAIAPSGSGDINSNAINFSESDMRPTTGDWIGLGIDTLSALGTGLINNIYLNGNNYDYVTPSWSAAPDAILDTKFRNAAQRAAVERNRLNNVKRIMRNTGSSTVAQQRAQQVNTDATYENNKLWDDKMNRELEVRNRQAELNANIHTRNAESKNQWFDTVAAIKNKAIADSNANDMAKAQSINATLTGLSQAYNNFYTSARQRYEDDIAMRMYMAGSQYATPSRMLSFGVPMSDGQLVGIMNDIKSMKSPGAKPDKKDYQNATEYSKALAKWEEEDRIYKHKNEYYNLAKNRLSKKGRKRLGID